MTATQEIKGHLGVKAETSQGDSYAEEMLVGNINAKSGVSIKNDRGCLLLCDEY